MRNRRRPSGRPFSASRADRGAETAEPRKLAKRLEKLAHRHKVEPVARSSSPQPASAQEFIVSTSAAPLDVLTGDGPVTWHGVTLFGVIDAGVAWQSAGAPFNGAYPQGLEYAISKNSSRSIWSIAPGGMGYSGVGLKSEEEILPGVAGVLAVDTNFSSASGQLANGPASLVQNNGVAPASQSANGDSARAGQAFNDFAYVGVSSPTYGLLTFGRQRTLTTDDRVVYDPIGGSLAFSLLGYSGALSSGDTENSRFDHSIKYLVHIGPTRFGAIYKLGQSELRLQPDQWFGLPAIGRLRLPGLIVRRRLQPRQRRRRIVFPFGRAGPCGARRLARGRRFRQPGRAVVGKIYRQSVEVLRRLRTYRLCGSQGPDRGPYGRTRTAIS